MKKLLLMALGSVTVATSGQALTFSNADTFLAAVTVPVPEGGSAVALLALALVGLEGLRRKFRIR